jgi:flagellar motor switch protein FliM
MSSITPELSDSFAELYRNSLRLAFGESSVAKKKTNPSRSVTRVRIKKATGTGGTSDQFQLCLPERMRDKLAEAAMANGRSLNGEIILGSRTH